MDINLKHPHILCNPSYTLVSVRAVQTLSGTIVRLTNPNGKCPYTPPFHPDNSPSSTPVYLFRSLSREDARLFPSQFQFAGGSLPRSAEQSMLLETADTIGFDISAGDGRCCHVRILGRRAGGRDVAFQCLRLPSCTTSNHPGSVSQN